MSDINDKVAKAIAAHLGKSEPEAPKAPAAML